MRTVQREKVYDYAVKVVLSLILLFCLYNVVCVLFLSPYRGGKLRSRVSSAVNVIESNIKHAGPRKTEDIILNSNLVNKTNDSFWSKQIKRVSVFSRPTKIEAVKREEEIFQYDESEVKVDSEVIFKGMVEDLAYIYIKEKIDGQWIGYGFPTKIGEKIGKKKVIGGKMFDFTTNYVLQDIVYNVQRLVTLNKKIVDFNEDGEFEGTRIVPGETYLKSTSKIKYLDENGVVKELWLNESDKMIRVKEDKLLENVEKKAKPVVSTESAAIDNLIKQQPEAVGKAKKPFEKNRELLRAVIEEVESGY